MRILIIFLLFISSYEICSQPVDVFDKPLNRICKYDTSNTMLVNSLAEMGPVKIDIEWDFKDGKMFIKEGNKKPYLYNDVKQIESDRFQSAHYTIFFNHSFLKAKLIHSNNVYVTIYHANCKDRN